MVQVGHPAAIYRAWQEGHFRLLTCREHRPLAACQALSGSTDDFLLALSEAGKADYLVTGDKSGLLSLARHAGTQIISASEFATLRSSGH